MHSLAIGTKNDIKKELKIQTEQKRIPEHTHTQIQHLVKWQTKEKQSRVCKIIQGNTEWVCVLFVTASLPVQ
jgi:hypothetical protein